MNQLKEEKKEKGGDKINLKHVFPALDDDFIHVITQLIKIAFLFQVLGNHEFDYGPDELVKFLELVNFDVVCANIDASREPIDGLFSKSSIKVVDGKQIGIVGYLYERTPEVAKTGTLT